jgi:hypothetical protein
MHNAALHLYIYMLLCSHCIIIGFFLNIIQLLFILANSDRGLFKSRDYKITQIIISVQEVRLLFLNVSTAFQLFINMWV